MLRFGGKRGGGFRHVPFLSARPLWSGAVSATVAALTPLRESAVEAGGAAILRPSHQGAPPT